MKILIVDDEIHTVRAIKHSVNWDKIQVEEVHTAYNVTSAKEMISHHKPEVVLCDIEMPQESGLDLLHWSKLNFPEIEYILLTCHAEFDYAKQAIELGSLDYLVKPIPFEELEKTIAKAVTKIMRSKHLQVFSQYGQYWLDNQSAIEERFWSELIHGQLSKNPKQIMEQATRRNVNYEVDEQYLVILISKKRLITKLESWNRHLLDYALKNIASEFFSNNENSSPILIHNNQLIVVLPGKFHCNDSERLKGVCREYIIACQQYLGCGVSCYIGELSFGEQLPNMLNKLLELDKNNVELRSTVISIRDRQDELFPVPQVQTPIEEWSEWLRNGERLKLQKKITEFTLNLSTKERINNEVLVYFQQDILQLMYSFLGQKGVQAHQLFKDAKSQELYQLSTTAIEHMVNWVQYFIGKAMDYTEEVEKSQTVIDKVKEYIHDNLTTDVTRDDLASHVFLNPDYLSRIFKKATGRSPMEYITESRIKQSIEMLNNTDMPIRSIASQVGYDNLAYFSKLFKKTTGLTPSDYRKQLIKTDI